MTAAMPTATATAANAAANAARVRRLNAVRRPYRYLVSLLMHHGERTLEHWLAYPPHFDAESV